MAPKTQKEQNLIGEDGKQPINTARFTADGAFAELNRCDKLANWQAESLGCELRALARSRLWGRAMLRASVPSLRESHLAIKPS